MHLALQPLFVLETSAFMTLLGKGWLVSKIPAALHLVAFCLGLLLLVRQSSLSDARKAIVLAVSFFVVISFEAYQFADYHVLADCFVLYSIIALLSLGSSSSTRHTLALAATLGALSALTLTTRLNDGAALFIGVFIAIACLAPSKRLLSLLLFFLGTALTLLLIVRHTGDTLHDYAEYSIFNAAGSKGGGNNVFIQPLRLPWNTAQWLIHNQPAWALLYALALALAWSLMIRPIHGPRGRWPLGLTVFAIFSFAVLALLVRPFNDITLLISIAALVVLLSCALGIWVTARFIYSLLAKHPIEWERREILLLIPLGQLASGSMSSGGTHLGLYGPVGFLIIVMAISSPIELKTERSRDVLFALGIMLILCTATFRFNDPYSWHTYGEKPLFANRIWYRHPDYGPMIIDRDLLHMIQPACQKLQDNGADNELLSIPFSYPNYFCAIPPWHGYVQTFFDTTSAQTIQDLMNDLQSAPPKWIFYQRQLKTLRLHEALYNQSRPLQQRHLDQLIDQKIGDGQWKIVYTSSFGNTQKWDNKWILIQTR